MIFTNYNMDTIHIHIVVLAKLLGKSGAEDRTTNCIIYTLKDNAVNSF